MDEKTAELRQTLDAVLRLLRHRARSEHEIRSYLRRRDKAHLENETLRQLKGWGYLDDEKFAHARSLALLRSERLGTLSVQKRLLSHGLSLEQVQKAVNAAESELGFDAPAVAQRLLQKKGLWPVAGTPTERARAQRFLLGRGFSGEVVEALVPGELDS